jgi:ABC-type nitrate/sulfonate/bicarbonate transport system permease component
MIKIWATRLVIILFMLLPFELAHDFFHESIPSAQEVLSETFIMLLSTSLYYHIGITAVETLAGFAFGIALGICSGILIGSNRTATDVFSPLLLAVYAVPKIIFLPIVIMIFGLGLATKVANAALHAFFPIVLNCLAGMRDVQPVHTKMVRSLGARPVQVVAKVYLRGMVAPLFTGMRLALGMAFLGSLIAELFQASAGLGFLVRHHYEIGEIKEMVAVIVVVFLVTLLLNALMKLPETRLNTWRRVWRT